MKTVRKRNARPQKTRILICCEGKRTEFNYFRRLCDEQQVRDHFVSEVVPGSGGDAGVTVRTAIKNKKAQQSRRGEPYKEAWVVLDVESGDKLKSLHEALRDAKANEIKVALSNPCFEIWYISHFEKTGVPFADCEAAENYLESNHWVPNTGRGYNKSNANHFDKLRSSIDVAETNARWVLEMLHEGANCVDSNSSTEVYRLIAHLRGTDDHG